MILVESHILLLLIADKKFISGSHPPAILGAGTTLLSAIPAMIMRMFTAFIGAGYADLRTDGTDRFGLIAI
jgi:hypothetical protein